MAKVLQLDLGFIKVREESLEALKAQNPGKDIKPMLNAWASGYLDAVGQGAILVAGKTVEEIERYSESQIDSEQGILDAVRKANKRVGDNYQVTAEIDPAYMIALEETSKWQSLTPEGVLTDAINTMLGNGWLYDWKPMDRCTVFTESDWAELRELTGKEVPFGRDIIKALRKKGESAQG